MTKSSFFILLDFSLLRCYEIVRVLNTRCAFMPAVIQLCLTLARLLRTVVCQAFLSMGFSRQEHWKRLPWPPPGDLLDPGIEPNSPSSPALQADSLPLTTTKPKYYISLLTFIKFSFTMHSYLALVFSNLFINPSFLLGHPIWSYLACTHWTLISVFRTQMAAWHMCCRLE